MLLRAVICSHTHTCCHATTMSLSTTEARESVSVSDVRLLSLSLSLAGALTGAMTGPDKSLPPIIKRASSPARHAVSSEALVSPRFHDPPSPNPALHPHAQPQPGSYFASHAGTPSPSGILLNKNERAAQRDLASRDRDGGGGGGRVSPAVGSNAGDAAAAGLLRVASPDGSASESGVSDAAGPSSTAPSSLVGSPPSHTLAKPGLAGLAIPPSTTSGAGEDPAAAAARRASSPPSPHCHFAPLPKVDGDRPATRRNSFANRVKPFVPKGDRPDGLLTPGSAFGEFSQDPEALGETAAMAFPSSANRFAARMRPGRLGLTTHSPQTTTTTTTSLLLRAPGKRATRRSRRRPPSRSVSTRPSLLPTPPRSPPAAQAASRPSAQARAARPRPVARARPPHRAAVPRATAPPRARPANPARTRPTSADTPRPTRSRCTISRRARRSVGRARALGPRREGLGLLVRVARVEEKASRLRPGRACAGSPLRRPTARRRRRRPGRVLRRS